MEAGKIIEARPVKGFKTKAIYVGELLVGVVGPVGEVFRAEVKYPEGEKRFVAERAGEEEAAIAAVVAAEWGLLGPIVLEAAAKAAEEYKCWEEIRKEAA